MSQENIELAYRAVHALPFDAEYRGHDGIRRWWKELLDAVPDFRVELVELRELGDVTVSRVRYRGHGAGRDAPFEQTRWQVAKWCDGKVVEWRTYASESEALEAVGLRE